MRGNMNAAVDVADTQTDEAPFDFTVDSIELAGIDIAPIDHDLRAFSPARCN